MKIGWRDSCCSLCKVVVVRKSPSPRIHAQVDNLSVLFGRLAPVKLSNGKQRLNNDDDDGCGSGDDDYVKVDMISVEISVACGIESRS